MGFEEKLCFKDALLVKSSIRSQGGGGSSFPYLSEIRLISLDTMDSNFFSSLSQRLLGPE